MLAYLSIVTMHQLVSSIDPGVEEGEEKVGTRLGVEEGEEKVGTRLGMCQVSIQARRRGRRSGNKARNILMVLDMRRRGRRKWEQG